MAKIEFPNPLKQLLEGSALQAPILMLADRVGEILADNKLTFFPDYTDHGTEHINLVLKSEIDLIPKSVWKRSKRDSDPRLLNDSDAAVIIGATLLHDIAMHLHPNGFLELISEDSTFQPLPWFKEAHEGHSPDRPWHELWDDYTREARRFSDRDLSSIIGEESAKNWKFQNLPNDPGQWERNHCLIIGEFIRRHHARLAHEIAIYGFPGIPCGSGEGQFPALGKETGHPMMKLADLIGLTARSHGISLRVCKAYLDSSAMYQGTPTPMDTAVLYPMALLRVADYLQLDRQRAPAVLLQLRNPQSPISVQEWKKHQAVLNIGPANAPRGKMIKVSANVSLETYLQLQDLLAGLQAEMDHSTAVLDEAYGTLTELGLNDLNLATRRVYSNLHDAAFRDNLPYVPNRTGFAADPNLLTLLVEPLYGKEPSVGVRELMQNAVDAVCELEAWCVVHGKTVESLDLPIQDGDVLIEYIKRDDDTWFLRIRDKGIGMSSDTIQNYFLRAGASFRSSIEWAKDFLDDKGQPRVVRAGRFGIGAFATFLLGSSFKLQTRHVSTDKSIGFEIVATINSQIVEIRRVKGLSIGTTIEVEMNNESLNKNYILSGKYSLQSNLNLRTDWFCWDWPKVVQRIVRGTKSEIIKQNYIAPIKKGEPFPVWSIIRPKGFDAVYWTFGDSIKLSCNGLKVLDPSEYFPQEYKYPWPEKIQLSPPCIAVIDSSANLPLTTQRYALSNSLPFIDELVRDVNLSFIAHALVCGPMSYNEVHSLAYSHPLSIDPYIKYHGHEIVTLDNGFYDGYLRWCASEEGLIPMDPWLYSLLKVESCIVYGIIHRDNQFIKKLMSLEVDELKNIENKKYGISAWHFIIDNMDNDLYENLPEKILSALALYGVEALKIESEEFRILVSSHYTINFDDGNITWNKISIDYSEQAPKRRSERSLFEAQMGNLDNFTQLKFLLEKVEESMTLTREVTFRETTSVHKEKPDVVFVAEFKIKQNEYHPETLIAKIWDECLGKQVIPFDKNARQALIAEGCKHPELKRHIDAWQEMKRTGSKWVSKV